MGENGRKIEITGPKKVQIALRLVELNETKIAAGPTG